MGRDDELDQLRVVAVEAVAGRGRLALVTGEAGIGKTALLRALRTAVAADGVHTLWGSCWQDASAPAYWPWIQLARAYAHSATAAQVTAAAGNGTAEIARLLPALRSGRPGTSAPADGESARFRFFDAVTSFFCRAAGQCPRLLVLDDLHWADPSSLALLSFAAGQLAAARILLVGAFRDDELAPPTDGSSPQRDLLARGAHIRLHGLDHSAIADLVAAHTGQVLADVDAAALRERTGGNPLFVRETAQLQHGAGRQAGLPESVQAVLDRRLARLSASCRSILATAALRTEVRLDLLAELTGRSMPELLAVATEAVHAGVLAPPTGPVEPYTFTHALMREALQQTLPPASRPGQQARIAHALQRRRDAGAPVQLAELAHHLTQAVGADGIDPRHVAAVTAAAARDACAALAYAEAAELYQRAIRGLEIAGGSEDEQLGPLFELAEALRRAGDGSAAAECYSRVVAGARRRGAASTLADAALGLDQLGVLSGADGAAHLALLSEALDGLGERDSERRALVLAALVRARYHLQTDSGEQLRRLGEQAVAVARRAGGARTLASCLMSLHDAVWGPGSAAERAEIAAEVTGLASDARDAALAADASLARCAALLELGDPRVDPELARFERLAAATKQPRYGYLAASRAAMQALRRGRLAEGERLIGEAERLGVQVGEPDAGNVRFCQLWELRGQQARRAELVDWGVHYQGTAWATGWAGATLVLTLLDAGDAAAARAAYRVFEDLDPAALPTHYGWVLTVTLIGEAAVAMDDLEVAGRVYAALLPHADAHVVIAGAVTYLGAIAHRLGCLAAALGRTGRARAHFEHAVAAHERMGAYGWAVRSRAELGRLLVDSAQAEDRARGAALQASAAEQADELGLVLAPSDTAAPAGNRFQRCGDVWTLSYAGRVVRLKDAKGLRDLATLLAAPGEQISALDLLVGGPRRAETGHPAPGGDPVLDERAVREYAARLVALEREMAATSDPERLERAQRESDALERELARARGLGGRARRLDDPAEKARKAVSARIKDTLARIATAHPELGDHLRRAARTGAFCSYSPAEPTRWQL